MDFKCTKCAEKFERTGIFVAHYRHCHTNYDKEFDKEMKELRKCRGMTELQRKLMAKQTVRFNIEEDVQAQVSLIEAGRKEAAK